MSHLEASSRFGWKRLILGALIQSSLLASLVSADDTLQPRVDVAQFLDSNGNSYIEVYYAIQGSGIKYAKNERGVYECQLVVDIEIFLNESLWTNKVWKVERSIEDTSHTLENNDLIDVLRYSIDEPGHYEISMHVRDMNQADQIDSVRTAIEVTKFASDKIEISDVELATSIKKMTPGTTSNFIKNTYEIMPSPMATFGQGSSNIYYYFEAYNLMRLAGDKYKAFCKILTADGDEVEGAGMIYRTKRKQFDSSIEIGMMNTAALASGQYRLLYGIADESKTTLASKEKVFYVYNPDVVVADSRKKVTNGALVGYSDEELDEEFEKIVYINTKDDRKLYKSLNNAVGKKEFINSIWLRPNDEQIAPSIFRERYLHRARSADVQFKSVFGRGWKSDRGRVLILYGVPSNVQRFPSTKGSMPYQIWLYDKLKGQGGVQFIFADFQGFSKYRLIHSDLRGETRNTEWKTEVFKGRSQENIRF